MKNKFTQEDYEKVNKLLDQMEEVYYEIRAIRESMEKVNK
jgi:hypothetical protein